MQHSLPQINRLLKKLTAITLELISGVTLWCNTDEPRQTLLVSKYQCCPLQDLTDKDCSFSALYLKITLFVAQILAFIDLDSTGRIALTASNQRKKLSFGVVSSRRSI